MISDRLKQIRIGAGLSQIAMAKALNVTQGAISQWERGTVVPDIITLLRIATMFAVALDDLLEEERRQLPGNELSQSVLPDSLVKSAVFGGQEASDAQFNEVRMYARWILDRDRETQKGP